MNGHEVETKGSQFLTFCSDSPNKYDQEDAKRFFTLRRFTIPPISRTIKQSRTIRARSVVPNITLLCLSKSLI